MRALLRIALVGAVTTTLCSCTDPTVVAQREVASVRALAQPGASPESIKSLLIRRGYECAAASGELLVNCDKHVSARGLCNEVVKAWLPAHETSTELQVHSEEWCL